MEDYDFLVGTTRQTVIVLTFILVAGAIIIGALGLWKNFQRGGNQKYFIAVGLFFIFFGLARLTFCIHDFFVPGLTEVEGTLPSYLHRLAYVFLFFGESALAYMIEREIFVKRTRYAFTIFGLVCMAVQFFLPYEWAHGFAYVGVPILLFLPFFVYLYFLVKSQGPARRQAATIFTGMVVLFVGQIVYGFLKDLGLLSETISPILAPVTSLVGLVILGYGLIFKMAGD